MAKKPLGKDKMGVQKVMRMPDYLGDAAGQFSLNAISGLIGQLTYFYTDKVGVAAGAIATALLIVKILDAFTDIIMGYIVDHTAPGKEKYRPWILRMILPMALIMILMFTVPANVSSPIQIAYLFITNFLFSAVIYTIICVPYQAIMVVRTNSQEERAKMGTWRAAAGYVSGMIIAVMIIPITNMLGGDQKAWVIFSAALAVISALLLFVTWKTSREYPAVDGQEIANAAEPEEENIPFGEALKNLFHNKYWVMALILAICSNIFYGLSNSSGTYYCKWIYGNDNLVGILGGVGDVAPGDSVGTLLESSGEGQREADLACLRILGDGSASQSGLFRNGIYHRIPRSGDKSLPFGGPIGFGSQRIVDNQIIRASFKGVLTY